MSKKRHWGANAEVGLLKVAGASQRDMASDHETLLFYPLHQTSPFGALQNVPDTSAHLVTLKPSKVLKLWMCLPEDFIPTSEPESVTNSQHALEFLRAQAQTLKQVLYAQATFKK